MRTMIRVAPLSLAIASLALLACGKGEQGASDSTAAAPAATSAAAAPATDTARGDKAFLEMMSDHHEGMIQMANAARGSLSDTAAKRDADKVHEKQIAERDSMVAMLKRDFSDDHSPTPPPSNQAMLDSLKNLRGRFLAKGFYELTVQHHREGVQMVDRFLPSLQNASVKAMAEKMKAEQQKEIAEFEKKGATKGPVDPRAGGEHEGH